jgi:hypothetical protein
MPKSRRRQHRAQSSHRARASAGITALTTAATVVTIVLIVAGSVLAPSGAATGKSRWHFPRATKTVTATATATVTVTATPGVPAPTATVTATQSVPGPTATVTTTVTASPSPSPTSPSSSTSSPTASPTSSPPPQTQGREIGVYMSGNNSGLDSYTSGWSVKPDVGSFYVNWPGSVPTLMSTYAGHGRSIQVELTSKISAGNFVTWADIAAGKYDTQVISYIKKLDGLGAPVMLALENEPDLRISDSTKAAPGQTAAQYVAAANRVADLIHANSTHVESLDWLAGGNASNAANFLFAKSKMDNVCWDPYKKGTELSDTATTLWAKFINNVLIPKGYDQIPRHICESGIKVDTFSNGGSYTTQQEIDFYKGWPAAMTANKIVSAVWFRSNSGQHDYIPTDPSVDQAFATMVSNTLG